MAVSKQEVRLQTVRVEQFSGDASGTKGRGMLTSNNASSEMISIFSAYHDPIMNEARIFSAVHPRHVCRKIQK
jgi:hypothetical protein